MLFSLFTFLALSRFQVKKQSKTPLSENDIKEVKDEVRVGFGDFFLGGVVIIQKSFSKPSKAFGWEKDTSYFYPRAQSSIIVGLDHRKSLQHVTLQLLFKMPGRHEFKKV